MTRIFPVIALSISLFGNLRTASGSDQFPELPPEVINRVEALKRINPSLLESSESIQNIVESVFQKIEGHPVYVELSIRFKQLENVDKLLEFAQSHPTHFAASEAIRFVMTEADPELVKSRIAQPAKDVDPSGLIQLVAGQGSQAAYQMLISILPKKDENPNLTRQILRSFCASKKGANSLLNLNKEGKLSTEQQSYASQLLSLVPWKDVRENAQKELPPVTSTGSIGLTIKDLKDFPADPVLGEKVFTNPVSGCLRCHVVGNQGVQFGPELTQIGDKLPSEALLESIQNPSAGIAFGFEAWEIELDTTEFLYGIIVSETDDFLILRDTLGTDQKILKESIITKSKSQTSAMPEGLPQLISPSDMAHLIEYLANLRK